MRKGHFTKDALLEKMQKGALKKQPGEQRYVNIEIKSCSCFSNIMLKAFAPGAKTTALTGGERGEEGGSCITKNKTKTKQVQSNNQMRRRKVREGGTGGREREMALPGE